MDITAKVFYGVFFVLGLFPPLYLLIRSQEKPSAIMSFFYMPAPIIYAVYKIMPFVEKFPNWITTKNRSGLLEEYKNLPPGTWNLVPKMIIIILVAYFVGWVIPSYIVYRPQSIFVKLTFTVVVLALGAFVIYKTQSYTLIYPVK